MKSSSRSRRTTAPKRAPEPGRGFLSGPGDLWLLAIVLALFVLLVVGRDLGLSFVGDDFIFLDKTRTASFARLWSPATSVNFGWYRPWSRELHFWLVQRIFGVDATAFRCVNAALWVTVLCLYASILRRLASTRVAAIATLGVAALAFWGTPLLWVSGSQDLWMLVFTLLGFMLFMRGRAAWALGTFVLALLSKETAGILPVLLCAQLMIAGRRSLAQAARQTWAFWSVLGVWAVLHPTLRLRMSGGYVSPDEIQSRPPWYAIPLKNAAACFNLDRIPHPQELTVGVVISAVLAALLLAGAAVLAARKHRTEVRDPDRSRLVHLAGAWTLIGWTPVLLPSVGWHAYYGCVGALGLWFALALWLQSRPRLAFAVIAAVALLRGAQANSVSADWGDQAYFLRAGSTLDAIRRKLMAMHAAFPPHSRVYFVEVPYHIGLVAGDSPAMRVWYADSTLQAGYYSSYRPRNRAEAPRTDYFFRFDTVAAMVEVKAGDEDVKQEFRLNPRWESDHGNLAEMFLSRGDPGRAAVEYEKVSQLRRRPDAALYAAACLRQVGDASKADSLSRAAQVRLHASDAAFETQVSRVERDVLAKMGAGR